MKKTLLLLAALALPSLACKVGEFQLIPSTVERVKIMANGKEHEVARAMAIQELDCTPPAADTTRAPKKGGN
jgi:hypothetical protein